MNSLVERIESSKVIAIIRGIEEDDMELLFKALLGGGIELAEITMNTKGALKSIKRMNEVFGSRMVVGAGTVLDEDMTMRAIEAGAKFLVSPNLDRKMIEVALKENVVPLPGVMTPTEVVKALKYGAPMVKLFPSSTFGAQYIKELLGPLDTAKIIAVGGVNKDNAGDYIKAGAVGVGVGGSLIDKKAIQKGNFDYIKSYAIELKKAVNI